MANFFTKLFGGGGGSTKQVAPESYFPSQDPRYQLVQKNLEELIAKRGFGYTPEMISSANAPYARARREGITNYEIPLISAQASARGLGRSTIPVNRIALSQQEGERDIEQRIAQLVTESERLKAEQYQSALSGESGLASAEIAAQQKARDQNAAVTNANRQADIQATQAAGLFAAQMVSPDLGDGLKTILPTKTGETYKADWDSAVDKSMSRGDNSALVNVSKNSDSQSLMMILKLLMALMAGA